MLFGASRRVRQLEEEVESLQRLVKARDLDWDDMRARCKRLLDRTEKAASRVSQEEETLPEVVAPKFSANTTTIMPTGDRMAKIQKQLAERGRKAG